MLSPTTMQPKNSNTKKFKLDMYKYVNWNGANSSFDFQLMSNLYWNFRDNIWYDPSGELVS